MKESHVQGLEALAARACPHRRAPEPSSHAEGRSSRPAVGLPCPFVHRTEAGAHAAVSRATLVQAAACRSGCYHPGPGHKFRGGDGRRCAGLRPYGSAAAPVQFGRGRVRQYCSLLLSSRASARHPAVRGAVEGGQRLQLQRRARLQRQSRSGEQLPQVWSCRRPVYRLRGEPAESGRSAVAQLAVRG